MNSVHNWISSDYQCDKLINSNFFHSADNSTKIRLKNYVSIVCLLDIPSQLIKIGLELALWPVVFVGAMGYSIVQIFKQKADVSGIASIALGCLLFAPASCLNRIRLIAVNLFGIILPQVASKHRREAFYAFPDHESFTGFVIQLFTVKPVTQSI